MPVDLNTEEPMARRFQLSVGPDEYDAGRFQLPPRPWIVGFLGTEVTLTYQRRVHRFRVLDGSIQYLDGRVVGDEVLVSTPDLVPLGGGGSRLVVIDASSGEHFPYGRALLRPLG
jgi:hypothetical protein